MERIAFITMVAMLMGQTLFAAPTSEPREWLEHFLRLSNSAPPAEARCACLSEEVRGVLPLHPETGETLRILGWRSEAGGGIRVDVLYSVDPAADGRQAPAVRNQLMRFSLQDGHVKSVRCGPTHSSDFWGMLLAGARPVLLRSAERGAKLTLVEDENVRTLTAEEIPPWVLYRVRSAGAYMIPLMMELALEGNESLHVPGKGYTLPPELSSEMLAAFLELRSEEEADWLRNQLLSAGSPLLKISLLERLAAIGEFDYPMDRATRDIYGNLFAAHPEEIAFRRKMSDLFMENNFLSDDPLTDLMLADPLFAADAGRHYLRHDAAGFSVRIMQWADLEEHWRKALYQSAHFAADPIYRAKMLRWREQSDQSEPFRYYIPILCVEGMRHGSLEIKTVLKEGAAEFSEIRQIAEWIHRGNPSHYQEEIRAYLQRNRKSEFLQRSSVYPMLLSALYRAGDPEALSTAITYLRELKSEESRRNATAAWTPHKDSGMKYEELLATLETERDQRTMKK